MEKIDTHCHIVPEGWRRWCEQLGWDKPDGMPCIPVRKIACSLKYQGY